MSLVVRGYKLPIQVRQTAATAAPVTVFAMLNGSNRPIVLRDFLINTGFDGTGATSTSQYGMGRFRSATPAGGTAITVVQNNTANAGSNPPSAITVAQFLDTGLTMAGAVFDAPFTYIGQARQNGASNSFFMDEPSFGDGGEEPFIILPGDGLCIRLLQAAVIGDSLTGFIKWDEQRAPFSV